ncbi:MFS multidrug-resistance DHA1 sub-family [Melanogaster broomeanus]|nr:MFS multidrug-resistance DHA1 sub-family [Melanogaster broomeanus]
MSSSRTVDEETPLLQAPQQKKGRTPLPLRQFSIILFLQLSEPLTSQVIAPFAPQLIRDIGITNGDETKVGYYVGLMHSLFFATQALTVLHWSRVSDHLGRKPVILTWPVWPVSFYVLLCRALNGALNGNIGVIKSMMIEITDSTNLAQAYAYMPIAWSSGATLGPLVGGSLSRPADRFPNVFGDWEFFKKYPYFLACAVPATFTAVAWLVTYLFLQESQVQEEKVVDLSTPGSSILSTETLRAENPQDLAKDDDTRALPLRALLIPRVLIAAGNYATLSLLDIAFRAVQPLFYATPTELGGLGLDPPHIGNILAIYGVVNGLFQIFFFADMHDRFGSKAIYSVSMASGIPLILTFPVINCSGTSTGIKLDGLGRDWTTARDSLSSSNLAYSCIFIYIAAASPNRGSLGATNATSMFSLSIQTPEHAWYAYYYLMLLVFIGIGASLLLPRKLWRNN